MKIGCITLLDAAMSAPRVTFWNRQLKDARPFEMLNASVWKNGFLRWSRQYQAKYIVPGRFKPVVHVILLVGGLHYAIEWNEKASTHQTWRHH